jgi:aryl-alcohol dehydrogenase-like predicted oxidoreductase
MEFRPLGRTGIRVSALCLGTMTFGNEADEATSINLVDRYRDAGGNFIDTADIYSVGVSEEIVGKALAGGKRDQVVLATKGRMSLTDDVNDGGAGRRHLTRAVEASLRRLGTDWIDLYQIHWPDPLVPLEETLATLDDLVRAGKIRHGGVSNFLGSHLQRCADLSQRYGWAPIASLQPQYSLLSREIELEILPWCAEHGLAVLPWSPLAGGVLSGKYRAGAEPDPDTRLGAPTPQVSRPLDEHNRQVIDAVIEIANELGRTPSQVALNWLLQRPGVTSPIIGARNVAQLEDNLQGEGWQLDPAHVDSLVRKSRTPLPYPHDVYRMLGIRSYR